ncbi:MAG: hypothetical protein KAT68_00660 [Bacteroidales bacterium]|nr:hypothetical protein [Bacteroidales bacterium]
MSQLGAIEILKQNKKLDFSGFKPTYKILDDYSHLISKAKGGREFIVVGGLKETLKVINNVVSDYHNEVSDLAGYLRDDSKEQSAFNVWHWMVTNLKYKLDKRGKEEIRTPARSYLDRHFGIDCDDYSVMGVSLLYNMGYNPEFNIVAFNYKENFGHIYITVNGVVVDGVMKKFNRHPDNITKTKIMSLDIEVLKGVDNINTLDGICGFGAIERADTVTQSLMNAQSDLAKRAVAGVGGLSPEMRKVRTMVLLNGSDERDVLLDVMPYVDDIGNNGEFYFKNEDVADAVEEYLDGIIEDDLVENDDFETEYYIDGLGQLGRRRRKRRSKASRSVRKVKRKARRKEFFSKVKKGVKKATKKVGRSLVRFNPLTIAARNGLIVAFGVNFRGFATKVKKNPNAYKKVVRFFEKMGGKKKNLDKAINKGAGKKAFLGFKGLGEPITIGGAITMAMGALVKIGKWLGDKISSVDIKKIIERKKSKTRDDIDTPSSITEETNYKNKGYNDPDEEKYITNMVATETSRENPEGEEGSKLSKWIPIGIAAVGLIALLMFKN